MKTKIYTALLSLSIIGILASCDNFLDREPLSSIAPETYFANASQLQAYVDNCYTSVLPSCPGNTYGIFANDQGTDNQIIPTAPTNFSTGQYKVPYNSGNWSFATVYKLNYFLAKVLPKFGADLTGSKNTISGDLASIKHFIGEMYFFASPRIF